MSKPALASVSAIQNGVAIVVINSPPVNSLGEPVMEALRDIVENCYLNPEVKAIVITGAGKFFVAGADIPSLAKLAFSGNREAAHAFIEKGHAFCNRIENGPKPVVAAINGDCLGGGCELALSCNGRVAIAKAKLGLPELQLGLIPGMGGTQRLGRLIGAEEAVKAILTSKPFLAPVAFKNGLIDAVVKTPAELLTTAGRLALGMATGQVPRRITSTNKHPLATPEHARVAVGAATLQTKTKSPNLTHPHKALDAFQVGLVDGFEKGSIREIENFLDCVFSPSGRAMLHFFLASKATTKIPGLDLKSGKPVKSVAILGGGTMGAGIAICFLLKNIPVILKEINQQALEAGVKRILTDVTTAVKMRKMNPLAVEHIMRGLQPQITFDGFDKVDLVIEAALENPTLKQKIFAELETKVSSTCVLATNTSTIDIDLVSANMSSEQSRSRVVGMHFFSPAHVMPLLEIIRTTRTNPSAVATVLGASKLIGKTPVLSSSCVGFIANRVFMSYSQTACALVQGGLDPYRVDKALSSFGMPMGVFKMNDSVGLDICTSVGELYAKAYPERTFATTLINELVKDKRLGQKSGAGFYLYDSKNPRKALPDAKSIMKYVNAARQSSKVMDTSKFTDEEIVQTVLYVLVNEGSRVVDEKIAQSAADIDVASVMGYGFPAYRGGIMQWGKEEGYGNIVAKLEKLSNSFGEDNEQLRGLFKPSDALKKLAANSK